MENPFENKPKRPTFITVLCILTFIGSGWGTISNLISIFTYNIGNTQIQIEQIANATENLDGNATFMYGFFNSSIEVLKAMAEHGKEIAIINLMLCLLSLIGAILMFNLRRFGFYFYTTAQCLMLFVTPYFVGFAPFIWIGMISSAVPNVVFIILYAVNLKYMH